MALRSSEHRHESPTRQWRLHTVLLLALAVLMVAAIYGPHLTHTSDDGYITYRYARNLANGHGLVFNPGEEHLGTTAPGWAVFLGLFGAITGWRLIPLVSGVFALLALVISLVFLCRRLQPHNWRSALPFALVIACNRWLVEVLGHEGFAASLFALFALELTQRKRNTGSGIAWGMAFFMRPDSAVMGAVSGITEWRRTSRLPVGLLVAFVLTALAAVVIVLWLAGSAVPFSLLVKRAEASGAAASVGPSYWQTLVSWGQRTWSWGGIPLIALAAWGWVRAVRENGHSVLVFLIPALAMLVFYPLVGVPFAPWYLIIPLLGVIAGAAAAVSDALLRGRTFHRLAALALMIASIVPTTVWSVRLGGHPPDPRAGSMQATAAWVETQPEEPGAVAAIEIGFLGFACHRPILDFMGLGSPGALHAWTTGGLAEYFLANEPAFLVYNPTFRDLLDPLVADPRFQNRYVEAHTVPATPRYGSAITIWRRSSGPKTSD